MERVSSGGIFDRQTQTQLYMMYTCIHGLVRLVWSDVPPGEQVKAQVECACVTGLVLCHQKGKESCVVIFTVTARCLGGPEGWNVYV